MRVKDWHKFQHYKERNPPWIKFHKSLLDDPDWHGLDPAAAKALVMIWLIASESDGELPEERKLAFRLRMTEKQCASVLHSLSHWLEHDASTTLAPSYQHASPETEAETQVKTETEGERAVARKPRLKKSPSELPDNFDRDLEAPTKAGLSKSEGDREWEKFKNHAKQNGRTCVDWQAAWRNWCIKAAEFLGRAAPSVSGEIIELPGFYAAFDSPQNEAWVKYERATGKSYPRDKSGGWRFPTEWPPDFKTRGEAAE